MSSTFLWEKIKKGGLFLCCRDGTISPAHLETLPRSCLQMSDAGLPTTLTRTHTYLLLQAVTLDLGALPDPVQTPISGLCVRHRVPSPRRTGQVHSWVIELHISCQDYFRPSSCIVRRAQTVYVIVSETGSGRCVLLVSAGAVTKDRRRGGPAHQKHIYYTVKICISPFIHSYCPFYIFF